MDKDDYWREIEKLPRGAKAELARRLDVPGYGVSKMFNTERKLRQEEAVIIEKFLLEYHGAKVENPQTHKKVTAALRPVPPIDDDGTRTVRLWTVVSSGDRAGGHMSIAETTDTALAPADLKHLRKAFSIDVWDDANSPDLPQGVTLYILRIIGRKDQWHVFGRPVGKNQTAIDGPVLGILLGRLPHAWRVSIGRKEEELPFADYPAAWQVRQIHY